MDRRSAPERRALFRQWDARGAGRVPALGPQRSQDSRSDRIASQRGAGLYYLVFKTDRLAESVNVARQPLSPQAWILLIGERPQF